MPDIGVKVRADGARQASAELSKVTTAINGIGDSAARYFAPAAIGYMVAGLARETFHYAAGMGDLRTKFKVSGETLQGWGYAAEKTGGQLSDVTTAYKVLGKSIGKAEGGNKDIAEMFQSFGVTDLSNQEQVFNQLARRIGEGGLSMKQLLDLTVLMGRNVNSLFPMFEEGFSDLQQEFRDLGLGIQDNITDKIKEADDSLVVLKYRMRKDMAPGVAWLADIAKQAWQGGQVIGGAIGGLFANGLTGAVDQASENVRAIIAEQNAPAAVKKKEAAGNAEPLLTNAAPTKVGDIARLAGGGGAPPADALARLGLSIGGVDTTRMHSDLVRLDAKLAVLVKHASKVSQAVGDADDSFTSFLS